MTDKNSGSTTVVNQTPSAPSLLPEARPGYLNAQSFYNSQLINPTQYTGPRVAPMTPGQISGINQTYDYFGAPQPYQLNAENQVSQTAAGGYLGGPESQQAIASLADPIFRRFRNETAPMLRDRSQFSGQGLSGSRREIANQNAVEDLGHQLALSAYAPVYNEERNRMLQAAGMTPTMLGAEAFRTGQLGNVGAQERGFMQQLIDANRQQFEEPLFRQGGAAGALLGQSGTSPGPVSSTSQTTQQTGTADAITGLATTALLVAALYGGSKRT